MKAPDAGDLHGGRVDDSRRVGSHAAGTDRAPFATATILDPIVERIVVSCCRAASCPTSRGFQRRCLEQSPREAKAFEQVVAVCLGM